MAFRGFGSTGGNRTFEQRQSGGVSDPSGNTGGPVATMLGLFVGDVADDLPTPAAARLNEMRDRAADLAVLARNSYETETELRAKRAQTENRIRTLQDGRGDGGQGFAADHPQVRREQAGLDKTNLEIARRREISEVRGHEQQILMRLIADTESWLRSGRPGGTRIVAFDGDALPKLKDGADLPAAIEDRRRRLRELAADRHRVESAPFLSATAKAKYRDEIAALGELGHLDVSAMIEHGGNQIGWPTKQHQVTIYNSDQPLIGFVELIDYQAVLAHIIPEILLRSLDRNCADAADDAAALTDAARAKALATINADYLATERAEAALVWLAQERGIAISHREDTDPRALLGIDLVVAGSSPPSDDRSHLTEYVGVPR